MTELYLRVDEKDHTRKVAVDMAYLFNHKMIRLPKYYFEDGLYLPYKSNSKSESSIEKYELTKDKIVKEDEYFYYFKFPLKYEQVDGIAA